MLLPALFALLLLPQYPVVPVPPIPPFEKYSAARGYTGPLAAPKITSSAERKFQTTLKQAMTEGYGVVDGGTEHERPGVNFAGHYVLVQWGLTGTGMEAAVIDAESGTVLPLPHIPGSETNGFLVPLDSEDIHTLQFRWNSRLLGMPYKGNGMTYYYVLDQGRWQFLDRRKTFNADGE